MSRSQKNRYSAKLAMAVCALLCQLSGSACVAQQHEGEPRIGPIGTQSGAASDSPADRPSVVDQAQIEALIERLGDSEFVQREQATSRLIAIGLPALKQLRRNVRHVDREIRFRCERILEIVLESDRLRRLQSLVARDGEPTALDLPGWERFSERFGDTEESRQLFAQMLNDEWGFLQDYFQVVPALEFGDRRPAPAGPFQPVGLNHVDLLDQRLQYLTRVVRRDVTRGSIAAMLFVATELKRDADHGDVALIATSVSALQSLCYSPTVANGMKDTHGTLRKMVGQWVLCETSVPGEYQNLTMSIRYKLDEGLVVAQRVLEQEALNGHLKSQAIKAFAEIGNSRHRSYLEKLLDDTTVVAVSNSGGKPAVKLETQMRDVALAAILFHEQQDLREFGFASAKHSGSFYAINSLGFAQEEDRDRVFLKWAEFRDTLPTADKK